MKNKINKVKNKNKKGMPQKTFYLISGNIINFMIGNGEII